MLFVLALLFCTDLCQQRGQRKADGGTDPGGQPEARKADAGHQQNAGGQIQPDLPQVRGQIQPHLLGTAQPGLAQMLLRGEHIRDALKGQHGGAVGGGSGVGGEEPAQDRTEPALPPGDAQGKLREGHLPPFRSQLPAAGQRRLGQDLLRRPDEPEQGGQSEKAQCGQAQRQHKIDEQQ